MKKLILALLLISGTAFAGITGTDPRPPKTSFGPGGGIPSPIGQSNN